MQPWNRPSMRSKDVVAVILAGGRGARLDPLTRQRAKPAVPFGGLYRIVDFTLSNCLHSGLERIFLLTQYEPHCLGRHVAAAWQPLFRHECGGGLELCPPRDRGGATGYRGTADAVRQNLDLLRAARPRTVVVLGGDHIYRMDYRGLVATHESSGADATVAVLPVPRADAAEFGTLAVAADGRVRAFHEKVGDPPPLPGMPDRALASMGIYCFSFDVLAQLLDGGDGQRRHDFGHDILPTLVARRHVQAHRFGGYWRDVGTVDSYFAAALDLVGPEPLLDLHDDEWPLHTLRPPCPPARIVAASAPGDGWVGDSLVAPGAVVGGARVERSILGTRVRIGAGSRLEECVLLDGVEVGRRCILRRVIVDEGVRLPDGCSVGIDAEEDAGRGLTVSPAGVTVIPQGYWFEPRRAATPSLVAVHPR